MHNINIIGIYPHPYTYVNRNMQNETNDYIDNAYSEKTTIVEFLHEYIYPYITE